jgi:hypothetical protein
MHQWITQVLHFTTEVTKAIYHSFLHELPKFIPAARRHCGFQELRDGSILYRGADKSLARPTSRCILFDGENISFDDSLVIYINSTNIPPIMIIGYMNIKIFCRCSLFPSWLG